METPIQQCKRLLLALEDLVVQESLLITEGAYDEVVRVIERAAPLVARVVDLAPAADGAARQQAVALIAQRTRNQERLAVQLARTKEDLRETQLSWNRVALIAPAYRGAHAGNISGRLFAQG